MVRNEEGVFKKFGVGPALIPDYLALVGDSADGYPGISGVGKISAVKLLNQYGSVEKFPKDVFGQHRKNALLFKKLATLKSNAKLFKKVDQLRWQGPTEAFEIFTSKIKDEKLYNRALKAAEIANQNNPF